MPLIKMKQISIWDLWKKEWENASKFFNCKGNTTTKSRLKDKWYKEFKEMLIELENLSRFETDRIKHLKTQHKEQTDKVGRCSSCNLIKPIRVCKECTLKISWKTHKEYQKQTK